MVNRIVSYILNYISSSNFYLFSLADIISLSITFLTWKTAKGLKNQLYIGNRSENIIKELKRYKTNIKSIECSIDDNLPSLSPISIQKDLGACIIHLKEASSLFPFRHRRKIRNISENYHELLEKLKNSSQSQNMNVEIMRLCQQTSVLLNDIICKMESEKI